MYTEFIQRLRRIDSLLREGNTGNARELAVKVGLSERSLYEYLRLMKSLHAPIEFCPLRQTYYYNKKGELVISFLPSTDDAEVIKKKAPGISKPL